ncbi:hypothetical protein N7540_006712 [Penicillium herquei]|nr:hypothetical protein N7540_006712 [Penicillium herquei]
MSGQRQETRSRWGCMICRKRRKKCDETRPACRLCTERGVQCVYPDWTVVKYSKTRYRESQNSQGSLATASSEHPVLLPARPKSTETKFIHHFHTIVASLITFTFAKPDHDVSNPFMLHILPRASTSTQVQHAVEAVAAAHLYHLGAESRERATQLHSQALKLLAAELSSPNLDETSRMNGLACSLLLIYYEIVLGNSAENAWCHLTGAKVLLEYHMHQISPEPPCISFFRKVFQYFNVMLALSMERRPLLITGHNGPEFIDKMDTVFGCAGQIWPLMHRLADLLARVQLGEDVSHDAQSLIESLHAWSIESSPSSDAYLEATVQIANAYKFCGILMLQRVIPQIETESGNLQQQHREIYRSAFDCVLRVCVLSTPMATLTWPLYVVGRLAQSASDRTLILHIFSQFLEKHHMMVVDGAKNAVKNHWNEESTPQSHLWKSAAILLG